MSELPSGTVTFLFTDLEGSSRLWEEFPEAMQAALARHDVILRHAIQSHRGYVVKTTGDGVHAAFVTAPDAVEAAIASQLGLVAESWPQTGPLRVRMGVHTGTAEIRGGDYYGPVLNRAARLMAVGHGGQVLVSGATNELLRGSGIELVDLGSHQLRDLGEPERVFQVVHSGLASEFAALRTLDAFATNLPLQVTTFVGRDGDVVAVTKALGENRLVTLIGVGGVGKTRLAVQTAAELLPHYEDGVWLCELGPVSDASQVPDVVAAVLGVQQRPGQTITESLAMTLRSRNMLVVVDNCEHVLDAAAELVSVLVESCPGLRLLATGREGLGVPGEHMMMVRSLPLPPAGASTPEILAADAIQLFTDRAEHAGGNVELDRDTVATVAQVCRRLDGIPLAIELAAARVRMMSPQEISARLDERFRLLTGGSRTAVERHQTLRRAVEWSYELLDDRERVVLDRLGVFAGGFTLDAVEAVVGDESLDALDVLDVLTQLVDKSLVVAERERSGTRYRLLETIRAFALERLDDAGMTDAMRRRHASWCAAFVAQVSVGVRGADEPSWLERIFREIDNVRAALTWATGADDSDLALSLFGNFGFQSLHATRLGYLLAPWAAPVLETSGAADDLRFVRVLAMGALDHRHHQRYDEGERDARRALELLGEPDAVFDVGPWMILCVVLINDGRATEVEGVDAFVEATRKTGDDYTLASALSLVAGFYYVLDDSERCREIAREALALAETTQNPTLIANSAMWLGAGLATTDPVRARALIETSVQHAMAVGMTNFMGVSMAWLIRLGAAVTPHWAAQCRDHIDLAYENGDTRTVLMFLDTYAQALAPTDRAEIGALLAASVERLAAHMSNPISVTHRRTTKESLLSALGEERLVQLSARGAALDYDQAVALAFGELDRVIVSENGNAQ